MKAHGEVMLVEYWHEVQAEAYAGRMGTSAEPASAADTRRASLDESVRHIRNRLEISRDSNKSLMSVGKATFSHQEVHLETYTGYF